MNEQEVLAHLHARIPLSLERAQARRIGGGFLDAIGRLFGMGGIGMIGQKILDALSELIGTSGLDVETVVAAAKTYFLQFTAPDNPSIPNFLESLLESLAWSAIERAIRRMFAQQPMP